MDLLLTTEISPWQILSAKLLAGFRVSAVLTAFLLWPVLLACVMVMHYWYNIPSVLAYLLVVAITCVTTSMLGLFCSVMFRKTVHSQICTYGVIIVLFGGTLALQYFAELAAAPPEQVVATEGEASPGELAIDNVQQDRDLIATPLMRFSRDLTMISPFAAIWDIPVESQQDDRLTRDGDWPRFFGYVAVSAALNIVLFGLMVWLFHARWRVAD